MYYISSNYCLYFIVDIRYNQKKTFVPKSDSIQKAGIAIIYYMDEANKNVNKDKISFEEFDPLWNTYSPEDREVLEEKFIPSQLSKKVIAFQKCFISEKSNFWSTRILLKLSDGSYVSISQCLSSFKMKAYERMKQFISTLGMNDSVFPYVITNKNIYCLDYTPYTIDTIYTTDPYAEHHKQIKVEHKIIINPPHTIDQWW